MDSKQRLYQQKAADYERRMSLELVELSLNKNEHVVVLLDNLKESLPKSEKHFKTLGGPWRKPEEFREKLRQCNLGFLERLSQLLRGRIKLAGDDSYPILIALLDAIEAHFFASMYDRAPEVRNLMARSLEKTDAKLLGKLMRLMYKQVPEQYQRDEFESFILSFAVEGGHFDKKVQRVRQEELTLLGKIIKKRIPVEEHKELKKLLLNAERYLSACLIMRNA